MAGIKQSTETEQVVSEIPLECAVCLQTCVHPVRLPCRHIFCFLCVKGVSTQVTNVRQMSLWEKLLAINKA